MLTRILEKFTGLTVVDRIIARSVASEPKRSVFAALTDAFGLGAAFHPDDPARVPRTGPVIFVCNHPGGFTEGLVVPAVIDALRGDLAVMAHLWFSRWPALSRRMFLVDPQRSSDRNAAAMKDAVRWVRGGRSLLVFPAGEVAHGRHGSTAAREKPWRHGLAALVRLTGATVVPIHVNVANRRRFHFLSWLHSRLGSLLLVRELLDQHGRTVRVRIGHPLGPAELRASRTPEAITARCRDAVLVLGKRRQTAAKADSDHAHAEDLTKNPTGIVESCAVHS